LLAVSYVILLALTLILCVLVLASQDRVALQCAKGFTRNRNMVTVSMNRISFKLPIHIDEIATMHARVCSVR
jgi:acyl-CoA hydrolase